MEFLSKGLVEEIITDIRLQKGYLPLLQYTLDLLWYTEYHTKDGDEKFTLKTEFSIKRAIAG